MKKEAHVPHCSLEKQFKLIDTFAQSYNVCIHHNVYYERETTIISFWELNGLYLLYIESSLPKDLVEIGPVVLDRKIKKLQTDGQWTSKKKSSIELSAQVRKYYKNRYKISKQIICTLRYYRFVYFLYCFEFSRIFNTSLKLYT